MKLEIKRYFAADVHTRTCLFVIMTTHTASNFKEDWSTTSFVSSDILMTCITALIKSYIKYAINIPVVYTIQGGIWKPVLKYQSIMKDQGMIKKKSGI